MLNQLFFLLNYGPNQHSGKLWQNLDLVM